LAELNPRLRLMFSTQFATGLRSGELIALRWEDIDFESGKIMVKRSRRHGKEDTPKTVNSIRQVHLPDAFVAKRLLEEKEFRSAEPADYVFLTQYGEPYTDVPHEPWKQALERAGVPYRRPYTLRHSYASHALENNLNLPFVSKSMGHADVNVTAQKYIRSIENHQSEEKKLDAFLKRIAVH
ncbi:MAG: site-specific integrase, partial [Cyanobacteria bacterium]|nr:site-specific integrase [Cyanobacteriota bacterium]